MNGDRIRSPALVECLNVHKSYPSGPTVFENVNVTIARGECVVLSGRGGTGKTTFLKLLIGAERPDSGIVRIDGRNVHQLKGRDLALLRQRLGVVFQDLQLIPKRTVYENVALPLFALSRGETLIRRRVVQTLAALRLQALTDVPCEALSRSESQKVAIGRALVHGPTLLLADEPTAYLDPEDSRLVVSLFQDLGTGGTTVILTAHGTPGTLMEWVPRFLEIDGRRLVERRTGLHRVT